MRSAPTVRPTIKRESLARWRTFALSAPSRCSWSSSGALPTSPQAPSTPERWLERQPPMWLRRISRNSPRIVTSWWKPATRWPRSIALNPPRPALVDWCPCRKFQCQHYFPCDFSYLSSFFFYIYIYLCRGIEGRDTMRDQRSGIESILYYRWSDLKTRVEKCKASWSEIEKFTRFSVMRWCKKKRERDIRRFPFFRFHLGDSIIEIDFFFYYRVRGD